MSENTQTPAAPSIDETTQLQTAPLPAVIGTQVPVGSSPPVVEDAAPEPSVADARVQPLFATGGAVHVHVTCPVCEVEADVPSPDGVSARYWLESGGVSWLVDQALRSQGCQHF